MNTALGTNDSLSSPIHTQPVAVPPSAVGVEAWIGGLGDGVVMSQKTSQCCRCCCLQPPIHWELKELTDQILTISEAEATPTSDGMVHDVAQLKSLGERFAAAQTHSLVTEDETTYGGRTCSFCQPASRKTTYSTHVGTDPSHPVVITHSKEPTCGTNVFICLSDGGQIRIPTCPSLCEMPYLTTKDAATGNVLGTSQWTCCFQGCLFVPTFMVYEGTDGLAVAKPLYVVRSDTCCMGACVLCMCCDQRKKPGGNRPCGAKCFRVPFYVRDPKTLQKLDASYPNEKAAIYDLFPGWLQVCCTKRDLYSVYFPEGASAAEKATLLGTAHLIDLTLYEQDQG